MSQNVLERIAAGRTDLILELPLATALAATEESGGASPLSWCAYYGDVSALRRLLDLGAPEAALGDNLGLSGAAFHGHWRLVQFVLERGADPRSVDPVTGETALHAALCRGGDAAQHQVVRVLLNAGADPAVATLDGRETGSFMRDARTRGETPLHRAAVFASGDTLDALLATGIPPDVVDARGETPLAWASWALRPDAILRRLCFGSHRIHPGRRPMQENLAGQALLSSPEPAP